MEELKHYGVIGMKWGVHRARSKQRENEKLKMKALNYDKKSAQLNKKSEKAHSKLDLEGSNRAAKKAATYNARASALAKRAVKTDSDFKRLSYMKKSEKLKYKATKAKTKADRVSKTTGYGSKAMRYSIKSDKVASKAAKARSEIASNELYIATMNKKMSSLSKAELDGSYSFVKEYLRGG